jgi:hypothetical protein
MSLIGLRRNRTIYIGLRLPVGRFLVFIFVGGLLLTLLGFTMAMATARLLGDPGTSV